MDAGAVVEWRIGEKFIRSRLAEKGGEQKKKLKGGGQRQLNAHKTGENCSRNIQILRALQNQVQIKKTTGKYKGHNHQSVTSYFLSKRFIDRRQALHSSRTSQLQR